MLLIQFNSLEFSTFLKFLSILVGGNHTLMLLSLLLEDQRFHIDILLFNFKPVKFMGVINGLMSEWIFKHGSSGHLDEKMSCHVIC